MSILNVDAVSIWFGGVRALSDVSVDVERGAIVGVIGPNGAGKTTLLNVVSGLNTPDQGTVTLDGTVITGRKPSDIARMGLGRTFQTSRLFPGMSVLENMMTGLHRRGRAGLFSAAARTRAMQAEEKEMRARALDALDFVGMREFAMPWIAARAVS